MFKSSLRRAANHGLKILVPDTTLRGDDLERCWFYCGGEFGYEIVSWAPYLRFLKSSGLGPIQVITRRGASIYYDYADSVLEIDPDTNESGWTRLRHTRSIKASANLPHGHRVVAPYNIRLNPLVGFSQEIRVDGHRWCYRDIHAPFSGENWMALDPEATKFHPLSPLLTDRPFILISNKRQLQWSQSAEDPLNSFDSDDLQTLCELGSRLGFRVLYNFFAKPDHLNRDLFSSDPSSDLVDIWAAFPEIRDNQRNQLLLTLFRTASLHLSVQGGGCYVPAMLGVPQEILMRQGDYVDYVTLAKITGSNIRCHYEVNTMVTSLEKELPQPKAR